MKLCRLALIVLMLLVPQVGLGVLVPTEIAVVASSGSRESQALARYYCKVRGVPEENICAVEMPLGEVLPHDEWAEHVRPAIRSWLEQHDPERRLRCLVTTWDVPLKIAPGEVSTEHRAYQNYLAAERRVRLLRLKRIASELGKLATGETGEGSVELDENDTLDSLKGELEKQLQAAQGAINERADTAEKSEQRTRLQQLATAAGGARVLLEGMNQEIERQGAAVPPELRTNFDLLRGRVVGFQEARAVLEGQVPGGDRDAVVLAMLDRSMGLLASIEWLDQQVEVAKKHETGASFDSELSLVLWPSDYQLLRWQPNYLKAEFDESPLRDLHPTLMVSRIDGPELVVAKRLIDDAIAVEQGGGLEGKVYIDARGLAKEGDISVGSYEDYDRALLRMAEEIRQSSDLEVVVDESPELFKEGDCPEAALYCGWYSLAKYVEALELTQGAVAVHLASAEATTLREKNAKNWCKRLLEEGCSATIGPVYEPYLVSFPRPDAFFRGLLEGDRTLVEVYYRTKPFNSWMMVLVGDPLYRPFTRSE